MTPKVLAAFTAVIGAMVLIAGVAMIYLPAAFVLTGGALLAVGLFIDFEAPKPRGGR